MALIRNIKPGETLTLKREGISITNSGNVGCRLSIESTPTQKPDDEDNNCEAVQEPVQKS